MNGKRLTVLVVDPDVKERTWTADSLESVGMRALLCPGPSKPDYSCIGVRKDSCALAVAADVVVLNMRLASDEAYSGIPGWGLLATYLNRGAKVVALVDPADPVRLFPDASLAVVRRPPSKRELLSAIRRLAGESTTLQERLAEHHAPWRASR